MKKIFFIILCASNFSLFAQDTQTTDPAHPGQELFNENCMGSCHLHKTSELFTRKDRKVDSKKGLTKMVSFCVSNLGIEVFPEDEEQITEHLNQKFYQYK